MRSRNEGLGLGVGVGCTGSAGPSAVGGPPFTGKSARGVLAWEPTVWPGPILRPGGSVRALSPLCVCLGLCRGVWGGSCECQSLRVREGARGRVGTEERPRG